MTKGGFEGLSPNFDSRAGGLKLLIAHRSDRPRSVGHPAAWQQVAVQSSKLRLSADVGHTARPRGPFGRTHGALFFWRPRFRSTGERTSVVRCGHRERGPNKEDTRARLERDDNTEALACVEPRRPDELHAVVDLGFASRDWALNGRNDLVKQTGADFAEDSHLGGVASPPHQLVRGRCRARAQLFAVQVRLVRVETDNYLRLADSHDRITHQPTAVVIARFLGCLNQHRPPHHVAGHAASLDQVVMT